MTAEEAIKMLPRRKRIHTYLGPFGADWERTEVIATLRLADPAKIMRNNGWPNTHRLSIVDYTKRGSALLIETRQP